MSVCLGPGQKLRRLVFSQHGLFLDRFILHSDRSNPYLETLEDLEREMDVFDPSVLVVGGLQMMDNFPFKEGKRMFDLLEQKMSFVIAFGLVSKSLTFWDGSL